MQQPLMNMNHYIRSTICGCETIYTRLDPGVRTSPNPQWARPGGKGGRGKDATTGENCTDLLNSQSESV
ncbi:hypothetical protein V496_03618 [Pseudogymnoascus sp. VKM F-4515 (FW-2607)]|nr:hypothetical protein V496_03618 [Pseudogymnoascus sp. VKM F-4515 (FW-2607)]